MKPALSPKWIYITSTLPILILGIIYYQDLQLIKHLLKEKQLEAWDWFFIGLIGLGSFNLLFAIYKTAIKSSLGKVYGFISLISHLLFLSIYIWNFMELFPFFIPTWILSANSFLYAFTFLMPTIGHSLALLILLYTPNNKVHKSSMSYLMALIIPLFIYLIFHFILPLFSSSSNDSVVFHMVFSGVVIGTFAFIFFINRGFYITLKNKVKKGNKYQLYWKIPLAIILPILGLLINNGEFPFLRIGRARLIFGDFSSYWFYLLTIINGVLLCIPAPKSPGKHLVLFIGRSFSFVFITYFFLVFLPFTPFSILAIIAFGAGILMLIPKVLYMMYITALHRDFKQLCNWYTKWKLRTASIAAFLVIPTILLSSYVQDRNNLHKVLDYVYTPDYSMTYDIDKATVKRTLQEIKSYKRPRRSSLLDEHLPYISSFYKWFVLDNLTLSDEKIKNIEHIFFGESEVRSRNLRTNTTSVDIVDVTSKSVYNDSTKTWTSWVDLDIMNSSANQSGYTTSFNLPNGCFISDYYLYVEGEKEMGLLAEKKTALWVYSSIVNQKRDPGMLYYTTGDQVNFRVFPFSANQIRQTGIEFTHREPFRLNIDGHELQLGEEDKMHTQTSSYEDEYMLYLSTKDKAQLKQVNRQPYFHFIVDISKHANTSWYSSTIHRMLEEQPTYKTHAKISFANSNSHTYNLNNALLNAHLNTSNLKGGFYLDRAIKKVLFNVYNDPTNNTYPVLVVLTDSLDKAVINSNYADFKVAYPENDYYYVIEKAKDTKLQVHSLVTNSKQALKLDANQLLKQTYPVYKYHYQENIAYLPISDEADIIVKHNFNKEPNKEILEKQWSSGLWLKGLWERQVFHPEEWKDLWVYSIKSSFRSKIMTPLTSYLVVENKAQKARLIQKQNDILNSKKGLDPGEEFINMSEPHFILMLLALGIFLWYKNRS